MRNAVGRLACGALLFTTVLVSWLVGSLTESDLAARDLVAYAFEPGSAESFDAYCYVHGTLPRFVMSLIGGALLGLTGSLMQQLTRNPMASPLTLGTSSGAWLAIVIVSAFLPELSNDWLAAASLAGALGAFGLIVLITGLSNMTGVTVVISGMVVNLLFGALASAVVLLRADFIENVFLWGAGDLAQNGWGGVTWLSLRAGPVFALLLALSPRALALISLGSEGAAARGLPAAPVFLALAAAGVWLVSTFVTAAGVISFVGLMAPNAARLLGRRSPRGELVMSALTGMAMLALTDAAAAWLSLRTENIVPTGVVAAAVGTPLFIALIRRKAGALADGPARERGPLSGAKRLSRAALGALALGLAAACLLTLAPAVGAEDPAAELWLRAPRLVTALFAGAGFAAAGVILQRLVHNPLASPDILGVSAGASCAMVAGALTLGAGAGLSGSWLALAGSLAVIALIIGFSKSSRFSPDVVILFGIALSAMLDSVTALSLSRGTMENYFILQWLSGSTYRATGATAAALALGVTVLALLALMLSRAMTLLTIGRDFAQARGLSFNISAGLLLLLCALLSALPVAAMGPVAFIGLVAPHMARLAGARTAGTQLPAAMLIGALLVSLADWIGQVIIWPAQIPAGTLASIVGAAYFLGLLIVTRLRRE